MDDARNRGGGLGYDPLAALADRAQQTEAWLAAWREQQRAMLRTLAEPTEVRFPHQRPMLDHDGAGVYAPYLSSRQRRSPGDDDFGGFEDPLSNPLMRAAYRLPWGIY